MKFKVIFFAIAGISLLGCKSNVAVKYNDMIVEHQNKLKAGMDEAEPRLKNYFATFEYDSIVNISARMEAKIDSIIQKLQKEPAPNAEQGENFKKVALNYFDYFKSVYTNYKNYGLQTSPEGRMYAGQDMALILSHEDKMIADMLRAQMIFARDNKFKIKRAGHNNSLVKK
jgi:hypothetical protein